ncbi:YgeY family selenium metabolism-linked hydrolase [Desulfovibrio litoralis]|uniref:Putative selenium metabolism hydrolase n=1 Tax=Desulfovibrio litoralis DSM 11393 TaxID=1121455 RepID=A0A1M7S8W3_9BACT|nr:YgeY family selenium metabolism-linked hydrolase [Desulfovibrio litoralis]SHN55027.1 putative selenium metabolism hydrolase [Desulfovibrio litoralis DSM 11393]
MLTSSEEKEVRELCQALIKSQSLSGHEDGVVKILKDYMEKNAFDEVFVDRYGSIIGCIKGKRPGLKILFDGHIDTVPVPDPSVWKHDPFGGEIDNGRIYGRGTSDMKGAVAAMCVAAAKFARDTKRDFAGSVYVAGVVHEECFEGIAAREISERVKPDVVIIGEASQLNLKIGQRGRAEVVIETFGVPAHSASPDKGVNAVHAMMKLSAELEKVTPKADPILGAGVSVLTDIISTPYPGASVVPSHCRATYDRRLLVGETPESVIEPYNEAIKRVSASDPKFKAKASFARGHENCHTGNTIEGERFFPGWLFEEKEEFIQKPLIALKAAGFNPSISHYSFCTNGSHYAGEKGIHTFGFGPSLETLAHTIDEYIEESQLYSATEGYAIISNSLLKD